SSVITCGGTTSCLFIALCSPRFLLLKLRPNCAGCTRAPSEAAPLRPLKRQPRCVGQGAAALAPVHAEPARALRRSRRERPRRKHPPAPRRLPPTVEPAGVAEDERPGAPGTRRPLRAGDSRL